MNQLLPQGGEPLTLADGTVINPEDGCPIADEETLLVPIPNYEQLQRSHVESHKSIADLPAPPEQMNTLSVIMCYSAFGVSTKDISTITGLTEDQIGTIRTSDVYNKVQGEFIESIVLDDEDGVRSFFRLQAKNAAAVMASSLNSDNEAARQAASRDILDRAGHRPNDVVEHRHKVEGGLKIEHIRREDEDIPTITVEHKEVM